MELKRYLEIIWKRKWILISTVVLVPLITYVMMKIIPPIYKSEAKLWIKLNSLQQKYIKDIPDTIGKVEFTDNDKAMGTVEEILNNSASINRVITEMGLTDRKGNKFTPDQFTNPNKISLITHLQTKGYAEEQITDTDIIKITGYSTSPSEAQAITSNVTKEFLSTFSKMYKDTAVLAKSTLLKRLDVVNIKLADATRALENYKAKHSIYSLSNQMNTLISEKSTLESAKDAAMRDLEGAKIDIEKIKNASIVDQDGVRDVIVKIENSTVLDSYKTQLLSLEMAQSGGSVEKTGEHPDNKSRKQQIELVKNSIHKEIVRNFPGQVIGRDSFFDRISEKYSAALFTTIESTAAIKLLDKQINERNKALTKFPGLDRELNNLQWDIDTLKTTRDSLNLNYQATLSADNLDLANAFVIQPATHFENARDNRFFPPKSTKAALVVAALLGCFLGLFIVFFIEYWNSDVQENMDNNDKAVN